MRLKRTVLLASFLILTAGSCSKTVVEPSVPCPNRPVLIELSEDLQLQMPPDAVFIVGQNQLALKEYAKKLEARLKCE